MVVLCSVCSALRSLAVLFLLHIFALINVFYIGCLARIGSVVFFFIFIFLLLLFAS